VAGIDDHGTLFERDRAVPDEVSEGFPAHPRQERLVHQGRLDELRRRREAA
jgi:hypothetical protein